MELTPFWKAIVLTAGTMALVWILVGGPMMRRRRKPSQLGEILRRLSEEREAQLQSAPGLRRGGDRPSADHDLADLDDRR